MLLPARPRVLRHRSFTGSPRKRRRGKPPRSIRVRPTALRSFTATESRSTTARRTASMPRTASCSILKARDFVTRKIARHSPHRDRPKSTLYLGNLEARRDWGHVRGMHKIRRRTCLTISCWLPARPVRCESSSRARLPKSAAASNGGARAPTRSASTVSPARPLVRIDPVCPAYRSRSSDASK